MVLIKNLKNPENRAQFVEFTQAATCHVGPLDIVAGMVVSTLARAGSHPTAMSFERPALKFSAEGIVHPV